MTGSDPVGRSRITAAIALGANAKEPDRTFKRALNLIEKDADVAVLRRSEWHGTDPVGPPGQERYLNGAVLVETTLTPERLLAHLRSIEEHLGRHREDEVRFGPRTLDLDILYARRADGEPVVVRSDTLTLPHPRYEERSFVLTPLAQIDPEHRLERAGRSVAAQAKIVEECGGLLAFETVDEARLWCDASRGAGGTLGFVPTMGALHQGHLELVRRAARENDRVCVSVFVNPLQFNDPGDLDRYPRDFTGDARLLGAAGCSMVFTGTLDEFFPEGVDAMRVAPGPAAEGLEGTFRPGHFEGVATIVNRLFDVVQPTRAYFGAKDFQQCLVVEALSEARGGRPEIVRCPIVRSPKGLALSSRNELLTPEARDTALALSRALDVARVAWREGIRDAEALEEALAAQLDVPDVQLEYAEIRDPNAWTADAPRGRLERAVALVAAEVGGVRLIDNTVLHEEE